MPMDWSHVLPGTAVQDVVFPHGVPRPNPGGSAYTRLNCGGGIWSSGAGVRQPRSASGCNAPLWNGDGRDIEVSRLITG
jgi:hypothetical protein